VKYSIELTREDVADRTRKIILALKDGPKSPSELDRITKLNRPTRWRNCKRLINIRLVIKEGGKFGKYRLTVNNYVARKATKFSDKVFDHFIDKMLVHKDGFCVDYVYHKDYIINEIKKSLRLSELVKSGCEVDSEPNEENLDDLIVQLQIHEFSRAVGAYITYVLIHAVSDHLWRPRTNFEVEIEPEGSEKEQSTNEWVRNSIDPTMINRILHMALFRSDWIKNAIVPIQLLEKFSRLDAVKRGQKRGSLVAIPKLSDLVPKNKQDNDEPYYERQIKNRLIIDDLVEKQKRLLKTTRHPLNFDRKRRGHRRDDDKASDYEIVDKTLHEKLMKGYKNIFPDYFGKLEDIRREIELHFSP
jgi:hypothetical protein